MRFPVSLLLQLCAYLLSFPRYNDLLIEKICVFAVFTDTNLVWSPTQGIRTRWRHILYEIWCQKL